MRSYFVFDDVKGSCAATLFAGESLHGKLHFVAFDKPSGARGPNYSIKLQSLQLSNSEPTVIHLDPRQFDSSLLGFGWTYTSSGWGLAVPYWFTVLLSAALALVPWLPWSIRFGLRTLLIGMTVVAVGLGVAVMLLRGS